MLWNTSSTVSVHLSSGGVIEETVTHPIGEPENPLGHDGVCAKFREMVNWAGMDDAFAKNVIDSVFGLEEGLSDLFELLKGDAA